MEEGQCVGEGAEGAVDAGGRGEEGVEAEEEDVRSTEEETGGGKVR